MDNYNSSDLDSVLKTLSGLASQYNTAQPSPTPPTRTETPPQRQSQAPSHPKEPPRPHSSQPKPPPSAPTSTASSITTWPAALRHVMRTVGQNEETQLRIRGLIRSQHNHERQWWKSREALVSRQQSRGDKKKELDAVLRSIGAPVDEKAISTIEEDKAELANYDAKVYKVSAQMADALMSELRGLDIPFFTLKQSLVVQDSEKDDQTQTEGKITSSELLQLRKRMLGLLEDLCKE